MRIDRLLDELTRSAGRRGARFTLAAFAACLLGACASDATYERGWIGGRWADVVREPGRRAYPGSTEWDGRIVGMPDAVRDDAGVLVTGACEGTPLRVAGLAPGDLVLAVDGAPVEDALELRERIESHAPGSTAKLDFWRDGATHAASVVVGRETWASAGTFRIGLALSADLDLWPFDDGINVLDVVRCKWDHRRADLDGPVTAYLQKAVPDEPVEGPPQESIDVCVLPIGVSKGKRVVRQEAIAASR